MKKAFTMLELVFVIIIIGILSVTISPNFQRDSLQEAANQLVSHIRYTQHLAMMDNKFDNNDATWFKERWQLRFSRSMNSENVWAYTIFSDSSNHDQGVNTGDIIARNPLYKGVLNASGRLKKGTGQYFSGGYSGVIVLTDERRMKELALAKTYGVKWVTFSKSCSNYRPPSKNQSRKIIFDNLGRPYWGYKKDVGVIGKNPSDNMYIVHGQCIITLCTEEKCTHGDKISIGIEPETGYTHIL